MYDFFCLCKAKIIGGIEERAVAGAVVSKWGCRVQAIATPPHPTPSRHTPKNILYIHKIRCIYMHSTYRDISTRYRRRCRLFYFFLNFLFFFLPSLLLLLVVLTTSKIVQLFLLDNEQKISI